MAIGPQTRSSTLHAQTLDQARIDEGLRAYMLRVYNYMATGLAISGLVAWVVANVPAVTQLFFYMDAAGRVYGTTGLGMIAMFAPLVMLLVSSFAVRQPSAAFAQGFYWAFVAVNGIGLSVLLMVYTGESLLRTFFITAAAFGGLSLYGYTTKRSLSGFASFLVMGVIGLLIAMVVNMFLASPMMQFVISAVGVLIFAGLIAVYTQAIKEQYVENMGRDAETVTAVYGALSLYIAFLNLFQFLLMFLGNRE
ncbi:MAG: Bax inhibitor-1/YccA family protein [Rhodospirillaceae bacterium]|nr:Bax inhibitor-1/YccA family protein [Rhodospirillaceae bacterium]